MKNCSKCGRPIDDEVTRCPDCGAAVDGISEPSSPQAQARSVKIRTFATGMEAQMASAFLESVGINALILADDCGGLLQPLAVSKGFRVMVSDEDLSRAEASLKDYEREPTLRLLLVARWLTALRMRRAANRKFRNPLRGGIGLIER